MASNEEEEETWLGLLKEFTGNTTFHGWSFVFGDTVFFLRRVIWFLLCGAAFGLFIYLVVDRGILLGRNPRSIDLEVIYTEELVFPSVTFCNQNLFRKSAAHKYGMFDVIQKSFADGGRFDEQFEVSRDTYIDGLDDGMEYYTYGHVTQELCKDICEVLKSEQCCSMVYIEERGDCYITPLDPLESNVLSLKRQEGAKYLKRKSCKTKSTLLCDFENLDPSNLTPCDFVIKKRDIEWRLVSTRDQEKERPVVDKSDVGNGTFMHASLDYRLNEPAEISTRDMLINKDTCLEFWYQVTSGILKVNTSLNGEDSTVWKMRKRNTGGWEYARLSLKPGYQKVKFLATWDDDTDSINASVDAISIEKCKPVAECMNTPTGLGYEGTMSTTLSGTKCQKWDARDSFFKEWTDDIKDGYLLENYCRNPDGDRSPWCFVNHETGQAEYCSIPVCKCEGDKTFLCDNNVRCLDRRFVCDGYSHCDDGTDEIGCENVTVSGQFLGVIGYPALSDLIESDSSVNCTFADGGCGYQIPDMSKGTWSVEQSGKNKYSVLKPIEKDHRTKDEEDVDTRFGSISIIATPPVFIDTPHCLEIDLWLNNVMLDIYTVRYVRSLTRQYIGTVLPTPSETLFPDNEDKLLVADVFHMDLQPQTIEEGNATTAHKFHILFKVAHALLGEAVMIMDNITLWPGTCEELERTTLPPPSTEFTTIDMNITEGSSAAVTEAAGAGTTEEYLIRQKRQMEPNEDDLTTTTEIYDPDDLDLEDTTQTTAMWDNTTFPASTEEPTTETPPSGDRLVRAVTNDTFCRTCSKMLGDMLPEDCPYVRKGIICQFNEGCGCGYSYFSTNSYFEWSLYHPDIDNVTDPNKYRDPDDSYARTDAKPFLKDRTTLMSPIEPVEGTRCLHFLYMTKYANLTVSQYSDTFANILLSITMDAQDLYWHRAQVTVEAGTYGISFEFQYDDEPPNGIVGIDDVNMLNGKCLMHDERVGVNCTFDEFDICGYKDVSPSSNNWFRSKGYQDSPGTQYFMRTRKTSRGKMSRKLLSPEFELEEVSCLQFYYFMQSYEIDDLSTFAVSLVYSRDINVLHQANNTKMVWIIRSITDNLWHKASARLEAGTYGGLMFEINGDEYRGGIAEVFVTSGECPEQECLDEQYYQCSNSSDYMACIPGGLKCNSRPNCDYGLDEASDLNCPVPEFTGVWTDDEKMISDNYDVVSGNVVNISSLGEMYLKLGSSEKNFITNCSFEGTPCDGYITQQPTDYGLCFTFNGNASALRKTKQTGASYGLSLTLNIEQDEYIVGPNPDAGIKMFLHPTTEIPQVRNLGFAVAPGTHTLVGIMRNEAYNLPDPWGDCSEIDLKYFETYEYSACQLECETNKLLDQCGCVDAYMPQVDPAKQPMCTTKQYFDCVVPFTYSIHVDQGNFSTLCEDCPKPCYQNIYEGSLSYAELSKLSVDTMLEEELKRRLETLRQTALAAQYRTTNDFIETAQVGDNLIELYKTMLQIADRNFAIRSDTVFRTALHATKAMADTAIDDAKNLFGNLQDQKNAYEKLYSRTTKILESKLREVKNNLDMIQELYAIDNEKSISQVAESTSLDIDMALDTHKLLMKKYSNRTFAAESYTDDPSLQIELNDSLPERFFEDEELCLQKSGVLQNTLSDVKKILGTMSKETRSNLTKLTNTIHETIDDSFACFEQYYDIVAEVDRWLKTEEKKFKEDLSDFTSFFDAMNDLENSGEKYTVENDYKATKEAVMKFLDGRSGDGSAEIATFLKNLKGGDGSVYSNIKRFLNQMKSRVSDPSTDSVNKVKGYLLIFYQEALREAANLEVYLSDNYFYSKGLADKMIIWKRPAVNRKDYTTVKSTGLELWKVWASGVSVDEFLEGNAKTEINKALNLYFNDITRNLEKFATDHSDLENDFRSAFDAIDDKLKRYVNQYSIDHTFIQENFLKVDVYFKQLKFQQVNQTKAYEILDFLGDFGGYLGLLLGGSVLSMFELFDFCFYNGLRRKCSAEERKSGSNGRNGDVKGNGIHNHSFASPDDVNVEKGLEIS